MIYIIRESEDSRKGYLLGSFKPNFEPNMLAAYLWGLDTTKLLVVAEGKLPMRFKSSEVFEMIQEIRDWMKGD